jgi:hypothetical protein
MSSAVAEAAEYGWAEVCAAQVQCVLLTELEPEQSLALQDQLLGAGQAVCTLVPRTETPAGGSTQVQTCHVEETTTAEGCCVQTEKKVALVGLTANGSTTEAGVRQVDFRHPRTSQKSTVVGFWGDNGQSGLIVQWQIPPQV